MPEALLKHLVGEQRQPNARLRQFRDPLEDLPAVLPALEQNDNEPASAPTEGERRMFEMPPGVWQAMIACYGVFLVALLAATGGARAGFAIAISLVYVIMFFGTARAMLHQSPQQSPGPLNRSGAVLQTAFGSLARREVLGQVLIVPAAVAFFGVAIAIISAILI